MGGVWVWVGVAWCIYEHGEPVADFNNIFQKIATIADSDSEGGLLTMITVGRRPRLPMRHTAR